MVREEEQRFWLTFALSGLRQLAGERTPQSLYHVLRGRIASQTYQDVHMFRLHPYYRQFPALAKERWQEILARLADQKLVLFRPLPRQPQKATALLTPAGEEFLARGRQYFELDTWLSPLDGLSSSRLLDRFWLRLHLLVQTVSHLLNGDRGFSPIVQNREVQHWVRKQLAGDRERWLSGLGGELKGLLTPFPMALQRLIVEQLSGAGQTGKTLEQIANRTGQAPSLLRLQSVWMLDRMVFRLTGEDSFPLLRLLCEDGESPHTGVSHSARLTERLLGAGYSVEEIARRRGLKPGTVEDHLVELALHCPDWDPSPFLSAEQRQTILSAARTLGTRRLRVIKDHLGDRCTYLQIRLALAGRGGRA